MQPYLIVAVEKPEVVGGGLGLAPLLFDLEPVPSDRSDRFVHAPGHSGDVTFDGIGVFGETLVLDSAAAARCSGPGRGNYFIERRTADGGLVIEIDPLGFYPLAFYQEDGLFAASNSTRLLARALRRLGRHVPRDLSIFAWSLTQGSGYRDTTGYRGLKLLEAGARVRLDARNRATIERRPRTELLYGARPFAELLDDACHEILLNVRAAAAAPTEPRVCDLSGGMDSRVVLAAILHEGLQDSFLFFTNGRHPNPDANVAALIRKRLGLRRTRQPSNPAQWVPSPFEGIRLHLGRFNALRPQIDSDLPRGPSGARHLSLGGGAGELLRQYWGSRKRASALLNPLHHKCGDVVRRGGMLTQPSRDALVSTLRQFSDEAVAEGIRPKDVADLLYLTTRAKYHFGVPWSHASKLRFLPLYSLAAVKAAYALGDKDRTDNRLGYEIMRRFSPVLVDLPFADKKWSSRLVPSAPDPVTARTPFLGDPDEPVVAFEGGRRRRRTDDTERALLAAGRKPHVAKLGAVLREFLAQPRDFDALRPVFDVDAVRRFLERPPEAFHGEMIDVNNAYRVIGAYVWATRTEITDAEAEALGRLLAAPPRDRDRRSSKDLGQG